MGCGPPWASCSTASPRRSAATTSATVATPLHPCEKRTSLEVFRAILQQFGFGSGLHQAHPGLRTTFPGPRLPAPWAVADAVVSDGRQQRIDQRRAPLRPRCLDLRGEGGHRLLGPLEAD